MAQIESTIRSIVAAEVRRLLAPSMAGLDRMVEFVGPVSAGAEKPKRRRVREARKAARSGSTRRRVAQAGSKARRGTKRAARRRTGRGDASQFQPGQGVAFRMGRGGFSGTVVEVDKATNLLTVETAEGKRFVRAASKVHATPPA